MNYMDTHCKTKKGSDYKTKIQKVKRPLGTTLSQ